MKVSELIKNIVETAEERFGVSDSHTNDCITVDIYYSSHFGWQVDLLRPTQHQLDCGKFPDEADVASVKVWESTCAFHTEADTLVRAIYEG